MTDHRSIRLGATGLRVSRMVLGTMTFGGQTSEPESFAIMDAAAAAGINFIDTANVYPSGAAAQDKGATESLVGRWLKGRRQHFVLTTKAGGPMGELPWEGGTSRKHLQAAIDESLARLGTDYVDLYQLHRDDPNTPLDETLEALDVIVRSGRARHVGVSNWTAWRIARLLGRSEARRLVQPVSVQPRYNLLFREYERDLFPMCRAEGLATLCYNPLAGGLLTGKHRDLAAPEPQGRFGANRAAVYYKERYWDERKFEVVARIVEVARQAGLTPERLSVAWVLAQPGVSCAILGASRAAQLPQVLAAMDTTLPVDVLDALDGITREFRTGDAPR